MNSAPAVRFRAGDLIFTSEITGDLLALGARSGKVLRRQYHDHRIAPSWEAISGQGIKTMSFTAFALGVRLSE
jgi:hypothetical protein